MKALQYEEYLRGKGLDDAAVHVRTHVIQAFEEKLKRHGARFENAGKDVINSCARQMLADGSNTLENFHILCGYALWRGFRPQYVALLEVTDCHNAMDVLRDTVGQLYGAEIRDQIFTETPPQLGADEAQRLEYVKAISGRMRELLTPREVRAAWFQVQHGILPEDWREHDDEQREKFGACDTVETFLDQMREDRNAMLRRMHDNHELWFTQEITDDALTYLIENRHMRLGEHKGRRGIVITKVPYNAHRVANETDPVRRRYYTCHCPMVRQAILNGETLPDDVCYCSLGHASHFLTGIGLEGLEGEVIESAVKGDARCRFIFYLPEESKAL